MDISALVFEKTSHCAGGDPSFHCGSYNDASDGSQEGLVWKWKDADWLSAFALLLPLSSAYTAFN